MRTELISIETDTTPLDGAFHWPEEGPTRGGVMLFHGNTMNFYIGAPRFLPPVLTKLGFACLAFNRRGHDILSVRNSRAAEGGAFQLTREGIEDNRLAAKWMTARGFPAPVVIGHSNGGMLGVAHTAAHLETPALVLLSAHRGTSGDATLRMQQGLAGDGYAATLEKARRLVAEGRGKELIVVPNWWYVLSAESYVDRFTAMPDTFDLAPKIKCPVLYVRGSLEPKEAYPAEGYQERAGGPCDVAIVEGADHFYNGTEDEVCRVVAEWLQRNVPA